MTRHKYSAKAEVVDGHRFPSQREAKRYRELRLLERAGKIRGLELQPAFPIVIDGSPVRIKSVRYPGGRKAKYTADFAYFEGSERVVEDVKSKATDTEASRLRRAVAEHIYSVEIRLV